MSSQQQLLTPGNNGEMSSKSWDKIISNLEVFTHRQTVKNL